MSAARRDSGSQELRLHSALCDQHSGFCLDAYRQALLAGRIVLICRLRYCVTVARQAALKPSRRLIAAGGLSLALAVDTRSYLRFSGAAVSVVDCLQEFLQAPEKPRGHFLLALGSDCCRRVICFCPRQRRFSSIIWAITQSARMRA